MLIKKLTEHHDSKPTGNVIVNTGAVIAVLLGIPSLLIGLFAATGVISGEKMVAGSLGTVWAYLAVVGAYELNRRKFNWSRGTQYSDRHLLAGTAAAAVALAISGAMHESMPALVIAPAISAIMQANDAHENKYRSLLHSAVLLAGGGIGIWLYNAGAMGQALLERFEALP